MNFHGEQAISAPTRATGRTVLFFSLLLGLSGLGWIDVADTSLLGLKIESDKFVPLLQLFCVLSVVAHVVPWYGDFVSYRGWNVTGRLPGVPGRGAAGKTKLCDLAQTITESITDPPQDDANYYQRADDKDGISEKIEELRWSLKNFDVFAKFYVYGWHLALPILSLGVAFAVNKHA